jgi:hypothetical protein
MIRIPRLTTAGLVAVAGAASAQPIITDRFENNTNIGGWTFGAPVESIVATGGSPGAFLHASGMDTTIPFLATGVGNTSAFTGNFRAAHIATASISLKVFQSDFPYGNNRPTAIVLVSDNGTPADPNDDWGAYRLSTNFLPPPGQWASFIFPIESQQTSLPAGWGIIQFGAGSPPNPSWNDLITHVSRLEFSFGDPTLFYIFQMWDAGADSIGLVADTCYANCDTSLNPIPFLNINDFICFQALFAAGDAYANCDGSTAPPVLTVNDFICFQTKFAAGCSAP